MKRGAWVLNLVSQILKGDLSLMNGLSFGLARIQPKPVSIFFKGIRFDDVDHTFWGILADIFLNRVYLPSNFSIHPNDIVVDIGAHRGGFTSFAAKLTSNMVIAFEPDPVNFSQLKKLIDQNNLLNVIAHNAAIGKQTETSHLFLSSSSSRHSLYRNQTPTHSDARREIEVNVISLDEALAQLDEVHLLKMDCEGAEIGILLNASKHTLSKLRKLAVETHDPLHSQKIKQLCERIQPYLPNIKLVDQKKHNLGYLYAWKSEVAE
jgi:FkbM family methyltransferase